MSKEVSKEVSEGTGIRALRVAIAGCHRMLTRQPRSHNWAAAFAAEAETQIVAVYDADTPTREAFVACWSNTNLGQPIAAYGAYSQMLREARPDIVCIATRQTQHAEQIEQAVAAGMRGILCDKPLATSLAEVDRIVAACRRAGVALAFGLERRWMRRYRQAQRLVAAGVVGQVQGIVAYGLPNLIHTGCHWCDVALWLAGDVEVAWVSGVVDDVAREPPESLRRLDPAGRAQIRLVNDVTLYLTPDGGPGLAFEVLGDRGRLLLLNDGRDAYLWQAKGPNGPLDLAESKPLGLPPPPATAAEWEAGAAAVTDLVAAVRAGGGATTACGVEEARRASEIGFAVHASSAVGGRRQRMDEVDRQLRVASLPWGNE